MAVLLWWQCHTAWDRRHCKEAGISPVTQNHLLLSTLLILAAVILMMYWRMRGASAETWFRQPWIKRETAGGLLVAKGHLEYCLPWASILFSVALGRLQRKGRNAAPSCCHLRISTMVCFSFAVSTAVFWKHSASEHQGLSEHLKSYISGSGGCNVWCGFSSVFFSLPCCLVCTFYSPCPLFDVSVCTFVAYLSGFSFSVFVEYKFIDESSDLWQNYYSQLKL